ncbi:MAG: PKD domain-containing protein [Acidobacteriota bacterium]
MHFAFGQSFVSSEWRSSGIFGRCAARVCGRALVVLACTLAALPVAGCGGSSSVSPSPPPTAVAPTAAFTFLPTSPSTDQTVQFTDTSTGSPTSWVWTFGDGWTSTVQNPTHAYSSASTFSVTLTATNATGSGSATNTVGVAPTEARLNIVLGRPTDSSVAASVLADVGTQVYLEYGSAPGNYASATQPQTAATAYPVVIELGGLNPSSRYYYRARYRAASETSFHVEPERSFQTARAAGSAFSFAIQGDSHPERTNNMFNADLYALNMQNAAARQPDFYIALGDDFSVEPLLNKGSVTQSNVDQLFANQRSYFRLLGHSMSVFLVNGNHEQAAAYLLSDQYPTLYRDNPIFQGKARTTYFALPAPDVFYSGDTTPVAGVGLLRDYYAWEWGDALFVTIDPYWHSPVPVDDAVPGVNRTSDPWAITMGDEQYAWFKKVLETSHAKYKFVFEHHVLGTGRGAAALVHQYEWGGYDKSGTTYQFPAKRPTWYKPIHQLMVENKVTIFFAGHDHLFSREQVDGVIYQEVPNPADNTYTAFNADAYKPSKISLPGARYDPSYGVTMPNAGHLYVTVSPSHVTVAYVRAVLPGDESKAGATNGAVAFSYSLPAASADQMRPTRNSASTARLKTSARLVQ